MTEQDVEREYMQCKKEIEDMRAEFDELDKEVAEFEPGSPERKQITLERSKLLREIKIVVGARNACGFALGRYNL
jgi:cell division septum initiation protein DivIVA